MAKKIDLDELLSITELTHDYQQVKRLVYATGEDRFENDAEHSFQLAFIAWYIIEKEGLSLNKEKVLTYALCHDIAEVYAGDANFYRTESEEQEKVRREKEAMLRLEKTFPYFPSLISTLHAYEERKDQESRFVYALDKILPMLNIFLDNGRSWHTNKVNYEKLHEGKKEKVSHDQTVSEYFILIAEVLKKKPHLFYNKQ